MSVTGTPSSAPALSLGGAPFAMNSDWCPYSAEPTLTRSAKTVGTVGSQVQRSREWGMSWNSSGFSLVVIDARPASTMTAAAGGAASWGLAGGRIVNATVVAAPATTGTSETVVVANPVSVAVMTYDWRARLRKCASPPASDICTASYGALIVTLTPGRGRPAVSFTWTSSRPRKIWPDARGTPPHSTSASTTPARFPIELTIRRRLQPPIIARARGSERQRLDDAFLRSSLN